MTGIDANVLVALAAQSHPSHSQAVTVFEVEAVSNTSPLFYLHQIGALDWPPRILFGCLDFLRHPPPRPDARGGSRELNQTSCNRQTVRSNRSAWMAKRHPEWPRRSVEDLIVRPSRLPVSATRQNEKSVVFTSRQEHIPMHYAGA